MLPVRTTTTTNIKLMKRYCFALDLKDDAGLIREYEEYHSAVWPEILESIRKSGVLDMEIYRTGTRLFMIMDTHDSFRFEKKAEMDASNAKVQEWEELMWKYQQQMPGARPGEKWMLLDRIFSLNS